MFFSWFKALFEAKKDPLHQTQKAFAEQASDAEICFDVPRYPPFMTGLPIASPSSLLATQRELLDQIRRTAKVDGATFDLYYSPLLQRFAAFVHLLPASQAHHHRGAGGLLRHSLEVALWSMQASDKMLINLAKIPSERRSIDQRWQMAVFLAGLCHDAGKPATDIIVSNNDRTLTWRPITESLYSWAQKNHVQNYFLDWRDNRNKKHIALASLMAEGVIGTETLGWIHEGSTDLVVWLMESLNDSPSATNQIHNLVIQADKASVERDLKSMGVAMAGYELGVPAERHLTDIMRRLIKEGIWQVNVPGARIWKIEGSVFLVWPVSGSEIARQVMEDKVPGLPRTEEGVLDMLQERKMAFLRSGEGSPFWFVSPHVLKEKIPDIALPCIKLLGDNLFSTLPLESVSADVHDSKDGPKLLREAADSKASPARSVESVQAGGGEGAVVEQRPEQPIEQSLQEVTTSADVLQSKVVVRTPQPQAEIALMSTPSEKAIGSAKPDKQRIEKSELSSASATEPTKGTTETPIQQKKAVQPKLKRRDAILSKPDFAFTGIFLELLNALSEDLQAGDKKWGKDVFVDAELKAYFRWPGAFAGYGLIPKAILENGRIQDITEINPDSPLGAIFEHVFPDGDAKAISFKPLPNDAFLFMSKYGHTKQSEQTKEVEQHEAQSQYSVSCGSIDKVDDGIPCTALNTELPLSSLAPPPVSLQSSNKRDSCPEFIETQAPSLPIKALRNVNSAQLEEVKVFKKTAAVPLAKLDIDTLLKELNSLPKQVGVDDWFKSEMIRPKLQGHLKALGFDASTRSLGVLLEQNPAHLMFDGPRVLFKVKAAQS